MKKLILLTIVIAFVVGGPGLVFANGVEPENASKYCKANDDLDYKNHGQCVSSFKKCYTPGNTGPVCVCKEHLGNDPTGF